MSILKLMRDRQMYKYGQSVKKFDMQGGVRNYLGEQETVSDVPVKWQSGPNHPTTELAYITEAEKNLLLNQDLHNSLDGGPNRGPEGLMSLNGGGYGSEDKGTNDDGSANSGDGGYSVQDDLTDYATNVGKTAKSTGGFKGGFGDGVRDVFGKIKTTVKDYVTSGGIVGAGIRGLTGLYDKVTGPPDLGIRDGYNMANIAGPKSYDFGPEDQGDDNQGIMAAYNPNILPVEEVPVSQEEEDFKQRFRVANEFRQDKQGQLDPAILEMISKLYT